MSYATDAPKKDLTLTELGRMRAQAEKIAMVTCYDATFATVLLVSVYRTAASLAQKGADHAASDAPRAG